jgi:DNA-binding CsgD family transcriptional regulator
MVVAVSRVLDTAVYLTSIALADPRLLTVYKMYIDGVSPSTIAYATGLSRGRAKGLLRRVQGKTGTSRAEAVLRVLLPLLMNIEPVIANGECRLCGTHVGTSMTAALHHIRTRHRDLVLNISLQIIEELRKEVAKA